MVHKYQKPRTSWSLDPGLTFFIFIRAMIFSFLHLSQFFLKNAPLAILIMNLDSIFVGEPEDERGRDFTWPSLGWVIPFTNSREPHGLRIPLWTDACDGSIFIWPNLLTVTRTGPRPSSGSPTKIFNLRCKNKKDPFLSVAREKRKSWLVWRWKR